MGLQRGNRKQAAPSGPTSCDMAGAARRESSSAQGEASAARTRVFGVVSRRVEHAALVWQAVLRHVVEDIDDVL